MRSARPTRKKALPLSRVYRLLEPGPVVLLTTAHGGRANVMTMSWHTMLEFEPPLVGCVVSSRNFSFEGLRASRQCVVNVPTVTAARTLHHRGRGGFMVAGRTLRLRSRAKQDAAPGPRPDVRGPSAVSGRSATVLALACPGGGADGERVADHRPLPAPIAAGDLQQESNLRSGPARASHRRRPAGTGARGSISLYAHAGPRDSSTSTYGHCRPAKAQVGSITVCRCAAHRRALPCCEYLGGLRSCDGRSPCTSSISPSRSSPR